MQFQRLKEQNFVRSTQRNGYGDYDTVSGFLCNVFTKICDEFTRWIKLNAFTTKLCRKYAVTFLTCQR